MTVLIFEMGERETERERARERRGWVKGRHSLSFLMT